MDDAQIRDGLHCKRLRKYHNAANTIVVDELGLKHGSCRADVAVINGRILGYEIKSDEDSLYRLPEQIRSYGDVFDRVTVVAGIRHAKAIQTMVPDWWGILVAGQGARGAIHFESVRNAETNRGICLFSVAQLLWKSEAAGILAELGVPRKTLRQRRAVLYALLVEALSPVELRRRVRDCLKTREGWRYHEQPSPGGGSSQPRAR